MKKITIGRAAENNIVFASVDTVSNYHSEIIIDDSGCLTYCDHSTNGSMVNGAKVHNSSCVVKRGDEIVLPGNSIVDWSLIPSAMQQTVVDHIQAQPQPQQRPVQAQAQPQPSPAYQQRPAQAQAQPQPAPAYQQRPVQAQAQPQPQQRPAQAQSQPAPAYQQRPAQAQAQAQPQPAPAYQQRSAQAQAQAQPAPAYQQRPAQAQPQPSPAYQQRSAQAQAQPAPAYQQPQQQAYQEYREQLPTKRGLLKMIIFGILTLGIYNLVIYCKISSEINTVARADHRHTMHYLIVFLLTPFTLGILPIIWTHKICNRIGNELKRRNIPYDFSSSDFWLWGVLGALIAVGPYIFIHKFMHAMNKINGSYNLNGE